MEEPTRGCYLPYAEDRSRPAAWIGISVLAMAGILWLYREETLLLVIFGGIFLTTGLTSVMQLLAWVHIFPEGIAITLFGQTLRSWSAERIRTIGALRKYEGKADPHDVLAVCTNTVEELTFLGKKHMPKLLQNGKDLWEGESAAKYLYRRAVSFRGEGNLHKHILWLDWSPERLDILRQMYPEAQWLDCTQKKVFDAQLKQ